MTPRRRRGLRRGCAIAIAITAMALVLAPIALTLGVWTFNAARCGREPVEATSFAAAYSYDLPGDRDYSIFPILVTAYYCTESDATKAGYRHNPLASR